MIRSYFPLFPVFLCFILAVSKVAHTEKFTANHTNIILIGSTGDLARKYLWQAIFNLYKSKTPAGDSFTVYGAARESHDTGHAHQQNILESQIKCLDEDFDSLNCSDLQARFISSCVYRQLTESSHYKELCRELDSVNIETGRLFYLAVPSTVYGKISAYINSHCRPMAGAWLRVVFEKPFGHDLDSAKQLAHDVGSQLWEEEIYRVDHYLGKMTMQAILKFRSLNREWLEPYWNRHWVDQIDIVSAETVDCHGRTKFYDQYGVIRDMLQNHLTEAMVLAAMDLPTNSTHLTSLKNQLLSSVYPPTISACIIGQYDTYEKHVQEDTKKDKEHSNVPTFAAVLIKIAGNRWNGVPFVLLSGKQLQKRTAYIRIQFSSSAFSINSLGNIRKQSKQEVIFNIHDSELQKPAILVSRNFPKPDVPQGWKLETNNLSSDYHVLVPVQESDPYTTIVNGVYNNIPDFCISTNYLLKQWHVWTPLLQSINRDPPHMIKYTPKTVDRLDFTILGNKLLRHQDIHDDNDYATGAYSPGITSQIATPIAGDSPEMLLGHQVIVGSIDAIITQLIYDIQDVAEKAIYQSGVFHLALPGGLSPVPLFNKLAFHASSFPWQQTHIWLTDERCVPFNHSSSNFRSLNEQLLNFIKLSYLNIHPIPVNLLPCTKAAETYEHEIQSHIINSSMDFVVLGVGHDGHTASLFPDQESLNEIDKLAVATVKGRDPQADDHHRVSLTFRALKLAKRVAVIVQGEGKREVMDSIRDGKDVSEQKYPVIKLAKMASHLTWYIDNNAWS
jgi:hexose-6-phosphate dehydrogenase